MAIETKGTDILKQLHVLFHVGAIGNLTDGQLLERFVDGHDGSEAAFTALVHRHGPMVHRLCQQILGNSHDVQDAFQATFLVLVRRAASIRNGDSVASWLHGVAHRVAIRARAAAFRRRAHERRVAAGAPAESDGDGGPAEAWPELHQEVDRLPEKYRNPIVLCYLEGLTTEAAAERLGCPRGTVLSRLARGRERLHGRLIRRGLAVSTGLVVTGLSPPAALAAVPVVLVNSTVQAAILFAVGRESSAGAVSATVVALTEGVLNAMFLSKIKIVAVVVLAVGLLAGGLRTTGLVDRANAAEEVAAVAAAGVGSADEKQPVGKVDRGPLEGTWEHTFPDSPQHRQVKIINQSHFVWVTYNREDGMPLLLAGGTYTFDGKVYKEKVEFGGPGGSLPAELVGKEQNLTAEFEGDKWTLAGKLSNGFEVEEIWQKVK